MKTFQIQYRMHLTVDHEINHHYFSFRCLPKEGGAQWPDYVKVRLDADYYAYSHDCFQNHFVYGYTEAPQTVLDYYMESQVRVDQTKFDRDNRLCRVLRLATAQTDPVGALAQFADDCAAACSMIPDDYDKAHYVMTAVHGYMHYEPGSTAITTTAAEAFANNRGVCQDYAQIMLAILRRMGIAARYVAGLMVNEALTHAWVEVYANGRWCGLDPTNNRLVDEDYVILSTGRDYTDCLVNKGVFYCPEAVTQHSDITISMEEIPPTGRV